MTNSESEMETTEAPDSDSENKNTNIAEFLIDRAQETPDLPAVICSLGKNLLNKRRYNTQTFKELNLDSARFALGLSKLGIKPQSKALVMVRPGPELFVITFGLFKAGVVPVLIDPGMDRSDLKGCIAQAEPDLFIGIPLAHMARIALGWGKRTVTTTIGVGAFSIAKHSFKHILQLGCDASAEYCTATAPTDLAAVLFTSGSTGRPKGALYDHRHFIAQIHLLQTTYNFRVGDFDVPTFPLFALFDPALGMSAVFPKMDFSKPASADPDEIFEVINKFKASNLFCSPALLRVLARDIVSSHKSETEPLLPSLQRVISAGAPVPPKEMSQLKAVSHPDAEIYTPYGATESLPICSISCSELLKRGEEGQKEGKGVCVGRVVSGVEVRIIPISDEPISEWSDTEIIDSSIENVGEIVVYGPSTTQNYLAHPQGDKDAKIKGTPPGVSELPYQTHSHRMGDLGYLDQAGYLWLCGRKSHRVVFEEKIYFSLCIEGILNTVSGVERTALVSTESGPVVCVELKKSKATSDEWNKIKTALDEQCKQHSITQGISIFLHHPEFPVDTRHNAKIKRELLKIWARQQQIKEND